MRQILVIAVFMAALVAGQGVRAQVTCAPGTHSVIGSHEVPNASYCAPDEAQQDDADDADSAPPSEPVWESRWGAIAIGEGAYGSAVNYSTQAAASLRAITECQANSAGKPCRVQLAFHDQCAALASGDGGSVSFGAATVERAKELALQRCFGHTGNCQIVYSGCSLPEQVG